ncbi:MAG TPA: bifunctional precorrin-2 dehydrogenase/sirohydrochlorin ferrochelatase [Armatimonadota bacterium]|jgi:precorrin-2 dehydrogenase/sirohydrochlorin ferrochelatase|nr:bifunctional precorrin-2 dehydrogenase/sirohydrochlorin ferrochelatase [Armatimonadota bacterium]HOM71427.1 bifunctional precorrin-2 dehydrogenase/sirohydrochlorin ferrochelatase [Armatimonadota bacterium]HOP81444.1 bifunctional precorrin-2 dehydrogenase/sirohydrochlorin ferrochelatase [Armatimonadota bacterium]HPP75195.1 bifunctional precorrin-2 dehydrogenase/sirohydrochlorin ferrochelatase [Armatimonadota bacterium]
MAYYPINIDLSGKKALVVGGGQVALRKIKTLLEAGALVTVVSPEVVPDILEFANSGKIELILRGYETGDLTGSAIAIAATDDQEVNARISRDCQAANILINVVDSPELCSFIVPAVIKRGDLTISISSAGKSPALVKRIREKIEEVIGPEYKELAELMGEIRQLAKEQLNSQAEREKLFKQMLDSDILKLIQSGQYAEARNLALKMLDEAKNRK